MRRGLGRVSVAARLWARERTVSGRQLVANTLRALLLCASSLLLASAAPSSAAAHENGLATAGCTGCHNGGREPKVTIAASASSIAPGQKITLSIAIEAINGSKAGLYLTATSGVGKLSVVDSLTKLSGSNGLVHNAPKTASGSQVTFTVDWTAPSQPGGVEFNAYVISANGDRRSSGDGAGAGFLSLAFGCTGTKYFSDRDGDGDGSLEGEYRMACAKPMYFSPSSSDCDDNDERIHTGATELCNARDDNCNTMVDEGLPIASYCEDKDGDGHGVPSATTKMGCGVSKGFGLCDNDCNDSDSTVYPTAQELCNYKDENCNGRVDEEAKLTCGEGWCRRYSESCVVSLCTPGEPRAEECNSFDDDCDGVIDNGDNLCGAGKSCVEGACVVGGAATGDAGLGDAGSGSLDAGRKDGGTGSPGAPGPVSDDGLGASNGGCQTAPSAPPPGAWALLMLLAGLRWRTRGRVRTPPRS